MSCTKDGGLFGKGSVKAKIVEEYMDGSNALYWGEGATFGLFNSSKANEKYRLSSGADSRNGKFKSDGGNDGATISGTVAVSPYYEGSTVTMTDGVATITGQSFLQQSISPKQESTTQESVRWWRLPTRKRATICHSWLLSEVYP